MLPGAVFGFDIFISHTRSPPNASAQAFPPPIYPISSLRFSPTLFFQLLLNLLDPSGILCTSLPAMVQTLLWFPCHALSGLSTQCRALRSLLEPPSSLPLKFLHRAGRLLPYSARCRCSILCACHTVPTDADPVLPSYAFRRRHVGIFPWTSPKILRLTC